MFGFGKGKSRVPAQGASERIRALSEQGMTGPDIISEMKHEGFRPTDVDRGFRDVLKRAAVEPQLQPLPPSPGLRPLGGMGSGPSLPGELPLLPAGRERVFKEDEYAAPPPSAMPGLPPMPQTPRAFGGGPQLEPEDELKDEFVDIDDLDEERAEPAEPRRPRGVGPSPGMVDSRLDRIDGDFEELQERMERMEGRLHTLELRVPSDMEKRETEALRMVTESQSKALGEVTMKMEALEKVLKDSLTPMMQTMRSLSDTLKAMKGQREP